MRLDRDRTILAVIDVQEKLLPVIEGGAGVVENIDRLARGFHILGVPAILTEQYVKGLGPTVAPLRSAFAATHGYDPIEKSCFSAQRCEPFDSRLAASGRKSVVVAGVETHVCVYQTCVDLIGAGFEVLIVADAVSSRTARNRDIALRRLEREGVKLTSTEMVLFELTVVSGTDEFRAISRLVK